MQETNRIEEIFDFDDKEKVENLRKKYKELTEKALTMSNADHDLDKETALMNRDRVFYENLLLVIDKKEKELKESFSPSEKNYIIERISQIVCQIKKL
jgi:hypothetical protein